jgi:hypothetical protein
MNDEANWVITAAVISAVLSIVAAVVSFLSRYRRGEDANSVKQELERKLSNLYSAMNKMSLEAGRLGAAANKGDRDLQIQLAE